MATPAITAWDADGNPIQKQPPARAWDENGNPIQASVPKLNDDQAGRATDALVYSNMTGAQPSYAYENRDAFHEDFTTRLGEYAEAGWKGFWRDSITGEFIHKQISAPFENQDEISKFTEGMGQMIGDLPGYLVGGGLGALAGGAAGTPELPVIGTVSGAAVGGWAGAFGLTKGLRQYLVDKYSGGKVSSFREIMDVAKESIKGALTGAVTGIAGEAAPLAEGAVGKILGPKFYKAAAELASMTTVGDALEGHVPTAKEFAENAVFLAALHVGTMGVGAAREYLNNTYIDSGTHPAETVANPESVPPPVEQSGDATGMLRPAIKVGDNITVGELGEHHQDILDRMEPEEKTEETSQEEPKEETGEQTSEQESEPRTEAEHGFVDPQGNYLNRQEARQWVDEHEPQVSANLNEDGASGELHTEDYNAAQPAKDRRPSVPSPTPEVSALRRTLYKLQQNIADSRFGVALRSFYVGNRDARIAETNQLAESLRKLVPDYRDQEALSLMRDFKNRQQDLEARRTQYEASDNEKLSKLVPIIDRALNPTPEMVDADKQLTGYFTKHLDEGKRLGFIDTAISNDQYITHLLRPESEGNVSRGTGAGSQIGRGFRFGRERKYETILDALETGTVNVRTLNALDALTIYGQKHATAAATRILINELKQGEMGKWGTKHADAIPAGWVELAPGSGLFRNIIPYIDRETGEPTYAFQSLMVPEKVRNALRPLIESSNLQSIPGFNLQKTAQAYIKAAELGLSVFHMKALSITALNNQGISGLVRSMVADTESAAFKGEEVDGIRSGLRTPILGRTMEAYRSLTKSTLPDRSNVIEMLKSQPGIKQLDQLAGQLTHFTFDVLQRKFKVMDYSLKKAAWMAKHPDATDEELTEAKQGIAKEVNAAYGDLNWEVLGASKTFRDVSHALLLAPDWTFSNIFNAKYAFEGGPAGAAARSFWIRSTLTGMALTQAMSIMVSGQHSSHPAEVYLGKDKDGREIYSDMFFAGAPKDMITFLNNVEDFGAVVGLAHSIGSKLSPVFRGVSELIANRDWMGREIAQKGKSALTNTAAGAWHFGSDVVPIPFSLTSVLRLLTDPSHDYGFWDYASVVGGTPPRHVAPQKQSKRQRPESTKEVIEHDIMGMPEPKKRRYSIRRAYR